ncbi:MAG: hypothetical protein AAGD28_04190 [Bacteroidota bacterium]
MKTRNKRISLSLFLFLVASGLYAQDATKSASYTSDTESIQSVLDAYYDCISGPIGEKRDFDRMRNLFHPEARLIYSYWDKGSSKAGVLVFRDVEEFIERLDYLDKKGFYEHELSNITHDFSSIVQVFSSYAFRAEDNSIPEGKGITSYDLLFDGDRYWIMSMFWVAENEQYKIPHKYLGK